MERRRRRQAFPFTAPTGNFAITWGLDNHLKTPYSESMDLSVQRELPAASRWKAAYVGRLGRHLLQSLDLAEPVDFVDPQGGGDYFTAGAQLSQLADQHGGDPSASVPAIPYFEHLFPYMANFDYSGESATQAIYSDEWAPSRYNLGATTALADIDFYCFSGTQGVPYPCPAGHQSRFWQDQFSSLYALSTIGMSYYNAAQITLRHPSSHGLQTDISYTYSHSIDMGSDAERSTEFNGTTARSCPERHHQHLEALPQPRLLGLRHPPSAHRRLGLSAARRSRTALPRQREPPHRRLPRRLAVLRHLPCHQRSSLLPHRARMDHRLAEVEAYGVATQPLKTHRHFDSNGNPQYFANAAAINSGAYTGSIVRLPYPGEAGERNYFRGDGYLNLDSGLTKDWSLGEFGSMKFAWEVYNVTNTVRFDPYSIGNQLTGGNLGVANALLSTPRRMQFSLRYGF